MRKGRISLTLSLLTAGFCTLYFLIVLFSPSFICEIGMPVKEEKIEIPTIERANLLLKQRRDAKAGEIFSAILQQQPDNVEARWGIAEILRRNYKFDKSRKILEDILKSHPSYNKAKVSLAYILFKKNALGAALKMVKSVIGSSKKAAAANRRELALAYMLLGSINAKRASKGNFLGRIAYGLRIRSNFERARQLAPELPEVHLGLGTFYLLAPRLFGGDISAAIKELEIAVELAPAFATPYARLAEAYLKRGDNKKFAEYLNYALRLDAENEVGLALAKEAKQVYSVQYEK